MNGSKFIASFWLACGLLGVALLASIQSQSNPLATTQAKASDGAPDSTSLIASAPDPGSEATEATPLTPQQDEFTSAPPPSSGSTDQSSSQGASSYDASTKGVTSGKPSGAPPATYAQMIPSNAVFGCDDPGPSLRDSAINGGAYNNALIVTQNPPPGSGVYGQQQGDLIVFKQSPSGESGAFRCGRTARYLNYFVNNPNEFQGFVFRVDEFPKAMICYAPAGAPCEDPRARLVTLLENNQTPPLQALQFFAGNLNLMRNVNGSQPVID